MVWWEKTFPLQPGETSVDGQVSSSEESELESDAETKRWTIMHRVCCCSSSLSFVVIQLNEEYFYRSITKTRKRPSKGSKPKQKRLRVQATQILHPQKPKPSSSKPQPVQSVFEQAIGKAQQPSKIGVKLADTISAIFEAGSQRIQAQEEKGTQCRFVYVRTTGFFVKDIITEQEFWLMQHDWWPRLNAICRVMFDDLGSSWPGSKFSSNIVQLAMMMVRLNAVNLSTWYLSAYLICYFNVYRIFLPYLYATSK